MYLHLCIITAVFNALNARLRVSVRVWLVCPLDCPGFALQLYQQPHLYRQQLFMALCASYSSMKNTDLFKISPSVPATSRHSSNQRLKLVLAVLKT